MYSRMWYIPFMKWITNVITNGFQLLKTYEFIPSIIINLL